MLPWLPLTTMSLAWGPFQETLVVLSVIKVVTVLSLTALGDLTSAPLRGCFSIVGFLLL